MSRRPSGPTAPRVPERRRNPTLREVLDELVAHVRDIARRARSMSRDELDYAQQRLEWLADEVWRLAVRGEGDESR
ncbi:MAG: hypothetical protein HYV20_14430 [Gemmatimonadetes bacterium]|nr:hypothetical protein [Gemmatimonadota bacterium]